MFCKSYTQYGVLCSKKAVHGDFCTSHKTKQYPKPIEKQCLMCTEMAEINYSMCVKCHKNRRYLHKIEKNGAEFVVVFTNTKSGSQTTKSMTDVCRSLIKNIKKTYAYCGSLSQAYDIRFEEGKSLIEFHEKNVFPIIPVNDDRFMRVFNIRTTLDTLMTRYFTAPVVDPPPEYHP